MKNKFFIYLFLIPILLSLYACTSPESADASEKTDTLSQVESTVSETENATSDTEVTIPETDTLPSATEESVTVNLEGVTITPQDNWTLLDYDEENQKVTYEIEVDGTAHEIILYTITDMKIDGNEITLNDASYMADSIPIILGYSGEIKIAQASCVEPNSEYIFSSVLYENDTKQTCSIIGDDRTLILECEPFIVLDEIAKNVSFSFERTNPDSITNFYSSGKCRDLPYLETSIIYRTDDLACNDTSPEPAAETEATNTNTPTTTTTKKEEIVPDTSEYKYYQMGDPMLDFSNRTIVTDNDPNFVIIKNGPGPIIKSSYPYIKTYYGSSGPYQADIMSDKLTLTIRSTDYYGCPYEVTINGVDYTFERRNYDYTDPNRDSSGWHCWLTDYNSPDCYIEIFGDVDQISMTGSLIYAYFRTSDFYDPSLLEQYPKND